MKLNRLTRDPKTYIQLKLERVSVGSFIRDKHEVNERMNELIYHPGSH